MILASPSLIQTPSGAAASPLGLLASKPSKRPRRSRPRSKLLASPLRRDASSANRPSAPADEGLTLSAKYFAARRARSPTGRSVIGGDDSGNLGRQADVLLASTVSSRNESRGRCRLRRLFRLIPIARTSRQGRAKMPDKVEDHLRQVGLGHQLPRCELRRYPLAKAVNKRGLHLAPTPRADRFLEAASDGAVRPLGEDSSQFLPSRMPSFRMSQLSTDSRSAPSIRSA